MAEITGIEVNSKAWVEAIRTKQLASPDKDINNQIFSNSSIENTKEELRKWKFGSLRGKIFGAINGVLNTPIGQALETSSLNKAWLVALAARQALGHFGVSSDMRLNYNQNKVIAGVSGLGKNSDDVFPIVRNQVYKIDYPRRKNPSYDDTYEKAYHQKYATNKVVIINSSVSPVIKIELQNRPSEISITPTGNWSDVQSMGRNNPFPIYTGGSDTLSMDISWYWDQKEKPEAVLAKCKLLESWSKANGYLASPPILWIVWGDSDMFQSQSFVLKTATYKLTGFNSWSSKPIYNGEDKSGIEHTNNQLYPTLATQTLVFQRVTSYNLTTEDIAPQSLITGVIGIEN